MKLKSGWGMTETCSPGTAHSEAGPDKPGSIGLMLPGIELDVVSLDDPTRVLPTGEVGEIRIRGPNVTKGYWNRPEETAAAFVRLDCLGIGNKPPNVAVEDKAVAAENFACPAYGFRF